MVKTLGEYPHGRMRVCTRPHASTLSGLYEYAYEKGEVRGEEMLQTTRENPGVCDVCLEMTAS